jgi:hypothetical protein
MEVKVQTVAWYCAVTTYYETIINDLNDGFEINESLGGIGMKFKLYDANWVEIKGIRHKPYCIMLAGMEGD